MASIQDLLERQLVTELQKYVDTQPRGQDGRWVGGAGARDALQAHLVDYKGDEGRDLTGPGTSKITDVAGGKGTKRYVDVPGLDDLHHAMGYDAVSTSTDMDQYIERRNKTFKAEPIREVKISDITWTQPRVNDEKVAALQEKMKAPGWDWKKAGVFVLQSDGKNYLLNGHHRVVAAAASGRTSYPAYVFKA